MPRHAERRIAPYSSETLYAIVADVKRYPEFLPWVLEAAIICPTDRGFLADLTVGYPLFHDAYRSEVILTSPQRIDIRYVQGPFKHLYNRWIFTPLASNAADVDFFIDFEFRSSLFHGMIQSVFGEAVKKMIAAFEARAKTLSRPKR